MGLPGQPYSKPVVLSAHLRSQEYGIPQCSPTSVLLTSGTTFKQLLFSSAFQGRHELRRITFERPSLVIPARHDSVLPDMHIPAVVSHQPHKASPTYTSQNFVGHYVLSIS